MELSPEQLSAYRSPFDELVGMRLLTASGSEVTAELEVRPGLHQPSGIVHGGVYASVVESTASVGATLWLDGHGVAVGLSNQTDFLRAVSEGRLRFTATPVQQGRTLQLWQVTAVDGDERLVAHGRVRLMNMRDQALPTP